jgi:hypothetical protein
MRLSDGASATWAANLAAAGWIPVPRSGKFPDSFAADVDAELAAVHG